MSKIMTAFYRRIEHTETIIAGSNDYREKSLRLRRATERIKNILKQVISDPHEIYEIMNELSEAESSREGIFHKELFLAGFFDAMGLMRERVAG